ncbi:hypothetical protein C7974DRAFT_386005 [Boeremia exigua]|uniref:uncharacterized protein n=1 Tax=Boeremia exigua TaxID=749465 RepID=UPI001E8DCAA4|nr:uncharacterized protein C7974DRAFT_386005 [Boeremia exigua]KAH6642720.1 hypothetical protein C7974DRAFT_386005 [Boeremia exigua]
MLCIGSSAWEDIYAPRNKTKFIKDEETYRYAWKTKNMQVRHGAAHARQRKLISNAFSSTALQGQEQLILSYIDNMINQLKVKAQTTRSQSNALSTFETGSIGSPSTSLAT